MLSIKEPISGNGIYLNIEVDVQEALEKRPHRKRQYPQGQAAGLVSATPAPAVSAIPSHPAFDPNQLTSGARKVLEVPAVQTPLTLYRTARFKDVSRRDRLSNSWWLQGPRRTCHE